MPKKPVNTEHFNFNLNPEANKLVEHAKKNLTLLVPSLRLYMTQIRDDSTFTSFGVTKKLKHIDHHFFAFEARGLILTFLIIQQ